MILAHAATGKTAVLAMGTPYLTEDFPTIQNYICTFSNATVSEISAAKALFGEIPIPGHLPVNLSNASVPDARTGHSNTSCERGIALLDFKSTNWLDAKRNHLL